MIRSIINKKRNEFIIDNRRSSGAIIAEVTADRSMYAFFTQYHAGVNNREYCVINSQQLAIICSVLPFWKDSLFRCLFGTSQLAGYSKYPIGLEIASFEILEKSRISSTATYHMAIRSVHDMATSGISHFIT